MYQPLFWNWRYRREQGRVLSPFKAGETVCEDTGQILQVYLRFHKKDTVLKRQVKMGFQLSLESKESS